MNQPIESRSVWHRIFGLDVRALALFRIAIGVLLLVDLGMRYPWIDAFYTDRGFLPRQQVREYNDALFQGKPVLHWSVHSWNGERNWQVALFGLGGAAAVCLAAGWQTRLATVISWVLLVSLHARNPLVNHSGDTLFRVALFWGMFLPLGAIWSLDSRKGPLRTSTRLQGTEVASPATAGLISGLFSLYFFAGLAKLNSVWFSGEAMQYVVGMDLYMSETGRSLRIYPGFLKFITWATLALEIPLALLLFSPWHNRKIRVALIALFVPFHIGIASTMVLGTFQYVAMAMWLALIPGFAMDWLGAKSGAAKITRREILRPTPVPWRNIVNGAAAAFLIYFLLWHVSDIRQFPGLRKAMPDGLVAVGRSLNMRQQYHMFDNPSAYNPWFVFDARLADGTHIDILRDAPVDYNRPASVVETFPGHHWRMFSRILIREESYNKIFRDEFSRYLMRRWNETHPPEQQVQSLKATAVLSEIWPRIGESPAIIQIVLSRLGADGKPPNMFDEVYEEMERGGSPFPY